MSRGPGLNMEVVATLAAAPIIGVVNQYLGFLPIAWAFGSTQKGFATLATFVSLAIGWIFVRACQSARVLIMITMAILALIFTLAYLGLLEWVSPNPHRLPLTELTLEPILVAFYALPFFFLGFSLSIFGWSKFYNRNPA